MPPIVAELAAVLAANSNDAVTIYVSVATWIRIQDSHLFYQAMYTSLFSHIAKYGRDLQNFELEVPLGCQISYYQIHTTNVNLGKCRTRPKCRIDQNICLLNNFVNQFSQI
jgi:hypothetical protein